MMSFDLALVVLNGIGVAVLEDRITATRSSNLVDYRRREGGVHITGLWAADQLEALAVAMRRIDS